MNQTMGRIAEVTQRALDGGKGFTSVFYGVAQVNDTVEVSYRDTVVASFNKKRNVVILNSNGWLTSTTKNVINAALSSYKYAIYQKDWRWYVADGYTGEDYFYYDWMTLPLKG
jgi:hypothetical protein